MYSSVKIAVMTVSSKGNFSYFCFLLLNVYFVIFIVKKNKSAFKLIYESDATLT